MTRKGVVGGILLLSMLSLLMPSVRVSAANVTVTEICNVKVTFKATVPASVQQGKSLTITNITVQPANSYGFTVSSSVFDMTATNTSSSTYHQDFASTSPSPTTGHRTYLGIYPNWSLDATGPVGSSIVIKLKKTVTVVQGFGTVNCNFSKTLATIPITAPSSSSPSSPSPSPSPSSPSSPSPSSAPNSSPSATPTTSSSTKRGTGDSQKSTDKQQKPDSAPTLDDLAPSDLADIRSLTVVPLIVEVRDSSGHLIKGAEVTLDGSETIKTDDLGRAIFSNVLTGGHNIGVSHKNQSIGHNVDVKLEDIGKVIPVKFAAPSQPLGNPVVAVAVSAAIVAGVGAPVALLVIRRRRKNTELAPNEHGATLHGIISGSAVEKPSSRPLVPVPAIPVFTSQPAAPRLAPWELPAHMIPSATQARQQTNAPNEQSPVQPGAPELASSATRIPVASAPTPASSSNQPSDNSLMLAPDERDM